MIALIIALGVLIFAGLSTAMVRQTRVMHRNLRYRARIIEAQRGRIMMLERRVGEALVQVRSEPRQAQCYPGASDGGLPWEETEEAFQRAVQRMGGSQPDDKVRLDRATIGSITPTNCEVTRPGVIVSGHPDEDYTVMSSDGTVTSYVAVKSLDGWTVGHAAYSRFEPNYRTIPANIVKE